MQEIKAIVTLPVGNEPMRVMTAYGTEDGRSFVTEFSHDSEEPTQTTYLPPEGQAGDWLSATRYVVMGDLYEITPPIQADHPDRDALQTLFAQFLREQHM